MERLRFKVAYASSVHSFCFGTTCALFCSRYVQQPCIFRSVLRKTCRYSMSRVVPSESCQETTVALLQMQLKAILLQVQRLQAQLDLQLPLLHLQLSRNGLFSGVVGYQERDSSSRSCDQADFHQYNYDAAGAEGSRRSCSNSSCRPGFHGEQQHIYYRETPS